MQVFQFQYGTIVASPGGTVDGTETLFQFQYGTIVALRSNN